MKTVPGYLPNEAVISEMTADASSGDIKLEVDQDLVERLTADDKDPLFVTIEVMSEGTSRNGKTYSRDVIKSIETQINEKSPDGYWGHLEDKDRATKYPEPQTIWLAAKAEEVDGKLRLYAKGYVLPEANKLRSYLRKAKAVGKNVAVSIYGLGQIVRNRTTKAITVQSYKLESIDWARPGSQGMLTTMGFVLTSEMTDDIKEREDMTKEEALQSATAAELKEHVSSEVVSEMVTEQVAEQTEAVVSEMTELRTELGLDEDASLVETVKEMTSEMSELQLDAELRDKVESPNARKIIRNMVIAEMTAGTPVADVVDTVLGSESGQAVIKEMVEAAPRVAPKTELPAATVTRKYTKKS